jgi:hypothetical protein
MRRAPTQNTTVKSAINFIYLYMTGFCAYTVFNNVYHKMAIYQVCSTMFVDLIAAAAGLCPIKKELVIHHIFVLVFISYFIAHIDVVQSKYGAVSNILNSFLSVEVSTVFLTIDSLIKDARRWAPFQIIYVLNRALFISSFLYFRLWNYTLEFLYPGEFQDIIAAVSKTPHWLVGMQISIYGIYFLNVYWTAKIARLIGAPAGVREVGAVDKSENDCR